MNPTIDSMIANEIGQWEHAINSYNGQDPLDLWFSFICWLESNLPTSQGLEMKFRKAVEQCLSMYDKYENYKQDLRMVKLWIKYIDFQPNPLNLYKILYQQGVGTKCAAFYIGWAHYYNSANHFKQAESIYNLGIQLKAEPLYEIETAQKNFRFSVAQRMLYNDESSKKRTISSLEEQRQQITSLSPHQNQLSAKRMRTDSYPHDQYNTNNNNNSSNNNVNNVNNSNSNGHTNMLQMSCNTTSNNSSNSHMHQQQSQQYQDFNPNNTYSNDPGYAISSSLNYVYDDSSVYSNNVEEQQQPPQQVRSSYTFECGFQMPQNFINYSRNSQDPWHAQLFLDEPYDPNRRCYYPKNLVYPGDGHEYSIEELKAHKWRLRMEEKRKQEELRIQRENEEKIRQEQERIRLEQERIRQERLRQEQEALRVRQEQERLRQEAETRRLREEQERIRKEQVEQMERQRAAEEAERIRKQQEEEQRNRYNQSYQMQQQQQRWNYHHSPANYGNSYYHQNYSPQYSYAHDHQYQTHYSAYQHSPQQSYANSPNYHQQSVIVNRTQYENHQYHQQQYYVNYQAQHSISYQMQPPPHPQQPVIPTHHTYSQPTPPPPQQQRQNLSQPSQQNLTQLPPQQQQQQKYQQDSDYQDVEYLIDHQAEIDPKMLQQPIVENSSQENSSQENSSQEEDEEESEESVDEEEEQIAPIVTSYMLDDLEEQIEASTISFSSNGKSRDKKITIKFRKEKTTTTIINSESNSNSSTSKTKDVPLESSSTSSSMSSSANNNNKKKERKEIVTSYDGENTQFMPSAANSCSSVTNGENVKHSFSKITFNGCVTPIKKQAHSKTSTPISSFKFLKNQSSFVSNQNDDSICSFTGDQNSFFQAENDEDFKSNRMDKALAVIDEHMKKRDIDPFNTELCRSFLVKLNFPNRENTSDYLVTNTNLPKLIKNQTVPIGDVSYQIEKEVGRGSYGAVYRGVNLSDGTAVALKYQRPSNLATWELYICTEVKKRIKNADILPGFMTISAAVIAPNASVLISEFSQYGSLLDINNRIRQATTKVMHESLVMHFTSQIFNIVAHLHDCKIIHADIKPDNFLLMTLPSADTHIPSLRLIDFGCAIDMKLFKEGQEFRKIIETDGFTCVEMQEGRYWSYQTDLFCIAGTIHVMLFGEYMQVNKKFGVWDIKQKFPRYLNKTLWTDVFSKLLNIKDSKSLPSLRQMKANVDREINDNELVKNIRTVSNLIRKR